MALEVHPADSAASPVIWPCQLYCMACTACICISLTPNPASKLLQVYSDPRNVDDDLVTSIVQPAESSVNAPEVIHDPCLLIGWIVKPVLEARGRPRTAVVSLPAQHLTKVLELSWLQADSASASSPGNPQVFRRIITGSGESINRLLRRTRAPLLLLWGDKVTCET